MLRFCFILLAVILAVAAFDAKAATAGCFVGRLRPAVRTRAILGRVVKAQLVRWSVAKVVRAKLGRRAVVFTVRRAAARPLRRWR